MCPTLPTQVTLKMGNVRNRQLVEDLILSSENRGHGSGRSCWRVGVCNFESCVYWRVMCILEIIDNYVTISREDVVTFVLYSL
jgi:hypothetical protein